MVSVIEYGIALHGAFSQLYKEVETNKEFLEESAERFETEKELEAFKIGALTMLGSIIGFLEGDILKTAFEGDFMKALGLDREDLN